MIMETQRFSSTVIKLDGHDEGWGAGTVRNQRAYKRNYSLIYLFSRCCFASTTQQLMANDATSGYQSSYYQSSVTRKQTHLRVSVILRA